MRKRATIAVAAVLGLVLVAGLVLVGGRWWLDFRRTDLQRAMALAPAGAERFSWTDWAGVRTELDAELSTSSTTREVARFLDEGYDADLTSTSALVESADVLQSQFGFSPATVDWELFSQSVDGAVVTTHLPESVDFADIESRLDEIGFTAPSSDSGVWLGGSDLLAGIAPGSGITPVLQFIALDEDERLLRSSDSEDYLNQTLDAEPFDDPGVEEVVDVSGEPLSAAVYSGRVACSALAMGQADEVDQAQADELVTAAGEVNPIIGFAIAAQPDGGVRVALSFESDEQARSNADSRAALAAGPAPGQGGDFTDRFEVDAVSAEGAVVTLDLDPLEGQYVLSDLSTGPVVFATC